MKKLILLALPLLLCGSAMIAQEASFGIKGGLNYGATGEYHGPIDVADEVSTNLSEDGENQRGFHVGIFSKFEIVGIFIQPELLYTSINSEYSNFDYKINKLDLPVLAGINVLGPLNIKAGPSFQYILKNELENTSLQIGDVENEISVGYQLGAGLELGRLGIDLRYEGAFQENNAFAEMASENDFTIDSRASQWILSASYSF
ncbi:outer membrane beta-barrel protein [Salegentibacter sp. F188]|uniref:Outer membrane beta-barrel protein n=1 Tax=Autumnicola patrickiae TaxID=3075591 RepID=A0ABU3E6D0_9FLAO|nr:outer membrane beta-barrel protein [Salegentibacter sp. F188]MDT0691539.1 outer membrane beta-barrel protein [Salegentibacter sp. F188]